jgi:hypothetical protein
MYKREKQEQCFVLFLNKAHLNANIYFKHREKVKQKTTKLHSPQNQEKNYLWKDYIEKEVFDKVTFR